MSVNAGRSVEQEDEGYIIVEQKDCIVFQNYDSGAGNPFCIY